ncbi:MAG: FtsX-like permease family protein [Bacteroidota bacterium]
MFLNYLKLAIKVLGRRKFFTFISLFGISFTLMILMIVTAFLDTQIGKNAPLTNSDELVFTDMIIMKLMVPDTTNIVDSNLMDGVMRYDTTFDIGERQTSYSSSSFGFWMLDQHVRDVEPKKNFSLYSSGHSFDLFLNNNKLTLYGIYTDAPYWDIFDFQFIEGKSYSAQSVENQEQVVVMTDKAAEKYFGRSRDIVGESIELGKKEYKIIGLIKPSLTSESFVHSDLYFPYTNIDPRYLEDREMQGGFNGVFQVDNPKQRESLIDAIAFFGDNFNMPNPERFNDLTLIGKTFFTSYAYQLVTFYDDPKKSAWIALVILSGLLFLFLLLPTLNLININVSRIMERSSEIGVRKAFGASQGQILTQFIFENIILTFLGGVIGLILAVALQRVINASQLLGDLEMQFNYRVFLYAVLICLVFGIISGFIPARRMSKLHVVNALKQA